MHAYLYSSSWCQKEEEGFTDRQGLRAAKEWQKESLLAAASCRSCKPTEVNELLISWVTKYNCEVSTR